MKFKTFEALLNNAKDLYETACTRDRQLQDALGGDTQVMTDFWDKHITGILDSIGLEYNLGKEDDTISWLFWDSMCNNDGYMNWEIDGVEYEGSPQNIWLDLENKLTEKYSI